MAGETVCACYGNGNCETGKVVRFDPPRSNVLVQFATGQRWYPVDQVSLGACAGTNLESTKPGKLKKPAGAKPLVAPKAKKTVSKKAKRTVAKKSAKKVPAKKKKPAGKK